LRCAILGDIHGNLPALEAVVRAIKLEGVDTILCVGDLVGYAANPTECIQVIRERGCTVVAGNHDFGAVDRVDLSYFNADARDAIEWTRQQLPETERAYLAGLPLTGQLDSICLVHSTPYFPEEFAYIQTLYDASLAFSKLEQNIAFVGHTHVPVIFVNSDPLDYFLVSEFDVPNGHRVMVNVGSVGQPRDMDPRASYAVLDTDQRKIFMRRVKYDVEAAADRILKAGLPETNAQRLFWGR